MLKQQVYETIKNSTDITSIIGTRIYSKLLPKESEYPAITYQRVVDTTKPYLKGLGPEKGRFQFSIYSLDEEQCEELLYALKKTMLEHKAVFLSAVDGYEDDTKLHTIKIDYSIIKRK